jgi:hypothetical protein
MKTSGSEAESGRDPSAWRTGLLALGGVAVLGLVLWRVLAPTQTTPPPPAQTASPPALNPMMMSTPFIWRGVRQPPTLSAAEASLADDDPVIGVCAGGRARAYSVRALSTMMGHVVNDVLTDVPVSVTFCDRSQRCKVFTGPEQGAPLDLDLGGWAQGQMLLKTRAGFYFQDSGQATAPEGMAAFPYGAYPSERTTWKAWREAHPDTDVYVGVGPTESRGAAPGASEKGPAPPP